MQLVHYQHKLLIHIYRYHKLLYPMLQTTNPHILTMDYDKL